MYRGNDVVTLLYIIGSEKRKSKINYKLFVT